MSTEDLHDLVGAYAVGALDELEARRFEQHLATCADCRAELDSYGSVLDALAEPAPGEATPDLSDLSARISAEVAVTPQAAQRPAPAGAGGVAETSTAGRRTFPRLLVAAAALIAVAAVGLGLGLGLGRDDDSTLASEVDRIRLADDVVALPIDLGDTTVYVSDSVGGIAVVGDAPALTAGTVYQVWVVPADGSAPVPGPVIEADSDGVVTSAWLTDLDGAAAVALSIEPDGGSTTPTEVVAAVELTV